MSTAVTIWHFLGTQEFWFLFLALAACAGVIGSQLARDYRS